MAAIHSKEEAKIFDNCHSFLYIVFMIYSMYRRTVALAKESLFYITTRWLISSTVRTTFLRLKRKNVGQVKNLHHVEKCTVLIEEQFRHSSIFALSVCRNC